MSWTGGNFVETPDGFRVAFTLPETVVEASLKIYRNGVTLRKIPLDPENPPIGNRYSIDGLTITVGIPPDETDDFYYDAWK